MRTKNTLFIGCEGLNTQELASRGSFRAGLLIVFLGLLAAFLFFVPVSCASSGHYTFSLMNTLSVFLLNNEKGDFFCIPVQYIGDYHIEDFDFSGGSIVIGDYTILLKRDDVNISVYLNESTDEYGNADGEFKLIYLEEKGKINLSKMDKDPAPKKASDTSLNQYCIFIEKYLKSGDVKRITDEYEKGNVRSRMNIEYDIVIDGETQNGNGMLDDFELYNGKAMDPAWFPPNLGFFKKMYLQ